MSKATISIKTPDCVTASKPCCDVYAWLADEYRKMRREAEYRREAWEGADKHIKELEVIIRKLEDGFIELMTGNYEEATKEATKRVVAAMYPPVCRLEELGEKLK